MPAVVAPGRELNPPEGDGALEGHLDGRLLHSVLAVGPWGPRDGPAAEVALDWWGGKGEGHRGSELGRRDEGGTRAWCPITLQSWTRVCVSPHARASEAGWAAVPRPACVSRPPLPVLQTPTRVSVAPMPESLDVPPRCAAAPQPGCPPPMPVPLDERVPPPHCARAPRPSSCPLPPEPLSTVSPHSAAAPDQSVSPP